MASGDTVFTAVGYPTEVSYDARVSTSTPVEVEIPLVNESSQNVSNGSIHLKSTSSTVPYGQGWTDPRSPIRPDKQYRVTITEV
jgi:hypothetical protein